MIAQRVLAVISAVLLVATVAIATFGQGNFSLDQALYLIDPDIAGALPAWSSRILGDAIWRDVVQPLLVRPAWLVPASLGLVCAGLSFSMPTRKATHRSTRRS